MDVKVIFFVEIFFYIVFGGYGTYICYSRPGRFLHHIAQLAGKLYLACSRNKSRLDEQGVSAYLRPRHAGSNSYFALIFHDVVSEPVFTQIIFERGRRYPV